MFRLSGDNSSKPTQPPFPLFLLPSLPIPFRRRKASASVRPSGAQSTAAGCASQSYGSSIASSANLPSLSNSTDSTNSTPPSSPTSPTAFFPTFADTLTKEPASLEAAAAPASPPAFSTRGPGLTRSQPDVLRCVSCSTDVAYGLQIVSKGFTGRHGRAYLVSPPSPTASPSCPSSPVPHPPSTNSYDPAAMDLVNVRVGRPENRQLVTGAHVVADISCAVCASKLGWKYVDAREAAQRYKVGKFILETARVVAFRSWEDGDGEHEGPDEAGGRRAGRPRGSVDASCFVGERESRRSGLGDLEGVDGEAEVVFDSDDEDECEDIFAGTWDAEAVAKRRSRKVAALKRKQPAL